MDKALEDGQRERGGRVDDRHAAVIPAAPGLPRAFAIEARMPPAADPPDPRQL
jgi:hypothetical protein